MDSHKRQRPTAASTRRGALRRPRGGGGGGGGAWRGPGGPDDSDSAGSGSGASPGDAGGGATRGYAGPASPSGSETEAAPPYAPTPRAARGDPARPAVSSSASGAVLDRDLPDWQEHEAELAALCFSAPSVFAHRSPLCGEFREFYSRYKALRARQAGTESATGYNVRYRYNFSLQPTASGSASGATHPSAGRRKALSPQQVTAVRHCLHMYLDFQQKQSFRRLTDLRQQQAELPIAQVRQQILAALERRSCVVIAGDTGCGKSTQVPQYLLAAGYRHIACTQPRRIAAIALARRVAYETLDEHGTRVGYQVRFESSKTRHTKLVFLTEGLLLRQVAADPLLLRYDVVIVDEVHERGLNVDFLLGVLKLICQQRALKLVLMSATINPAQFADFLGGAEVLEVPGRLFPITVEYCPLDEAAAADAAAAAQAAAQAEPPPSRRGPRHSSMDCNPYLKILGRIATKYPAEERGDVLVFVPGAYEVDTLVAAVSDWVGRKALSWTALPLHAGLSTAEQDRVFLPTPLGTRKVVVATNIAETSITIDGIRFVLDSGRCKQLEYIGRWRLASLQERWVSQASAAQRAGRAGRTGPGHCYRLYSPAEFAHLDPFTAAEVRRLPVEHLALQIKALQLGDPRTFPFLERPPEEALENALTELKAAGALDPRTERVTPTGRLLAGLPVDLPLGKLILLGCVVPELLEALLSLAATFCVQSVFSRRGSALDLSPAEVAARHHYDSPLGDGFTALAVLEEWRRRKRGGEETRRWCREHFVEEQRLYEALQLRQQFVAMLRDGGLLPRGDHGPPEGSRGKGKGAPRRPQRRKPMGHAGADGGSQTDDEEETDVRYVELLSKAEEALGCTSSAPLTPQQTAVLQALVCCGLYPNVACADEGNANRIPSEWLYNTRFRPLISMHPSSVFYGVADGPDPTQLVCYQKLLETKAVYLVNCCVAPLVPGLLLTARYLDTDQALTQVVADGWVALTFAAAEEGQRTVAEACALRALVEKAVQAKLRSPALSTGSEPPPSAPDPIEETAGLPPALEDVRRFYSHGISDEPAVLPARLAAFVKGKPRCAVRVLKHNEAIGLLVDRQAAAAHEGLSSDVEKVHQLKRGVWVTPFLLYGSVRGDRGAAAPGSASRHLKARYACPRCGAGGLWNAPDIAAHDAQCAPGGETPAPGPRPVPAGPGTAASTSSRPSGRFLGTPLTATAAPTTKKS